MNRPTDGREIRDLQWLSCKQLFEHTLKGIFFFKKKYIYIYISILQKIIITYIIFKFISHIYTNKNLFIDKSINYLFIHKLIIRVKQFISEYYFTGVQLYIYFR